MRRYGGSFYNVGALEILSTAITKCQASCGPVIFNAGKVNVAHAHFFNNHEGPSRPVYCQGHLYEYTPPPLNRSHRARHEHAERHHARLPRERERESRVCSRRAPWKR